MNAKAEKTATLPSLRVDQDLRAAAEKALDPNESLSGLIETAVRNEIAHRTARTAFLVRGLAAGMRARESGQYRSADEVVERLEGILAKHQAREANR